MKDYYYRLEGKTVVPATAAEAEAMFSDHSRRVVEQTTVGEYWISTVFLPIDHRVGGSGPPVVFETMVFNPKGDSLEQDRYCTWEEAEAGHTAMVARYKRINEHSHAVVRAMRQETER